MASVTYKHVYKRYGDVEVIKDLNLDVEDKEFVVFVGPSGCGKSTCLRMLAGLEEISEGEIMIGDRVVNDVPPKDRDIAMVFQSYALYPHMSVYDNMAFGLKMRKVPKEERKQLVQDAAEVLGIQELLDRCYAEGLTYSDAGAPWGYATEWFDTSNWHLTAKGRTWLYAAEM